MRTVLLTLLLASSLPAFGLQGDVPYAHFTDKDREIFQKALDATLEGPAEGASRAWSNPGTKAHGEIKPVKGFERDGKPCRDVSITNNAKGRSATGAFTFCRDAAGKWTLAPRKSPKTAP